MWVVQYRVQACGAGGVVVVDQIVSNIEDLLRRQGDGPGERRKELCRRFSPTDLRTNEEMLYRRQRPKPGNDSAQAAVIVGGKPEGISARCKFGKDPIDVRLRPPSTVLAEVIEKLLEAALEVGYVIKDLTDDRARALNLAFFGRLQTGKTVDFLLLAKRPPESVGDILGREPAAEAFAHLGINDGRRWVGVYERSDRIENDRADGRGDHSMT